MRVDYVVSDVEGDSVRLRVEYSVNGVDWKRASIVGDTLIGRCRYSGYLIWRSGLDLPNYGDVIFRITPRDNDPHNWGESCRNIKDLVGNVSGEQIYDFYPDDGNSNPSIVLTLDSISNLMYQSHLKHQPPH